MGFKQRPDTLRSDDSFEGLLGLCAGPIKGPRRGLKSIYMNGTPLEDESGQQNFLDFQAIFADGDPLKFPQKAVMKLGQGGSPIPVNLTLTNTATSEGTPGPWITKTVPNVGADALDIRLVVQQLYEQTKKGIFQATLNVEVQLKPTGTTNWINPLIDNPAVTYDDMINYRKGRSSAIGTVLKMMVARKNFKDNGEWIAEPNSGYVRIIGKTMSSPYVHELRIEVPNDDAYAGVGWDVRCRLIEPESIDADPNFLKRTISWESVSAVYQEPLGGDEAWRGLSWLHLFGKASDQLTGVPEVWAEYDSKIVSVPPLEVFDPETRTYTTATWDGSWAKGFTTDPAWIINDAISDSLSGLSNIAPGSYLNKWDALEASKWFSEPVSDGDGGLEPRFSLNLVVDQMQKASEFVQYMAGAVCGLAWENGDGEWRLKVEKPETPIDIFTLENIEGEFSYAHTDVDSRFNDYLITFKNKEFEYREDRVRVFDQAHIDTYGRKPTSIVAIGCTGRQEALRRGMMRLRSSINETRMVTFTTNRRGRYLEPLNTILVADGDLGYTLPDGIGASNPADDTVENNRTTGRVISMNGARTQLTLRDTVRLEIGVTYKLHLTVPNPNYNGEPTSQPIDPSWKLPTITITRNITNTSGQRGDVSTLYLDSALPSNTPELVAVAIEAAGLPTIPKMYRVTDVKPAEDGERVAVTAMEVDTGKYAAADNVDASAIAMQVPTAIVPAPLEPTDGPFLSVKKLSSDNVDHTHLQVNWGRPGSAFLAGFRVRYKVNDGPWITGVERTQDTSFELVDPAAGTYKFEIVTIDRRNAFSTALIGSIEIDGLVVDTASLGQFSLALGAGMKLRGRTLEKATGTDIWDTGAYSLESYVNGASASLQPLQTNKALAFGLNTDPTIATGINSIDYGFICDVDGNLYVTEVPTGTVFPRTSIITEAGEEIIAEDSTPLVTEQSASAPLLIGPYEAGDVLKITYNAEIVEYSQNDVVVRTVAAPRGLRFKFDSAFHSLGAKADNVVFAAVGAVAPLLITEWSVNGTTGWHTSYSVGDLYMRQSADAGITFSTPVRVVGEDGSAGEYTNFIFKRSVTQPSTPAMGSGVLPAGWSDSPPTGADPLWMTTAQFLLTDQLTAWATPTRLDGEDAARLDVPVRAHHFDATYTGVIKDGQLPLDFLAYAKIGEIDVSDDATWSVETSNCTVSVVDGEGQISEVTGPGYFDITAEFAGISVTARVDVSVALDAPPVPPSSGVTIATSNAVPPTVNSGTYPATPSAIVTVSSDSSGRLQGVLTSKYYPIISSGVAVGIRLAAKFVYRLAGSGGAWSDFGSEVEGSNGSAYRYGISKGVLNIDQTKTGLTASTDYEVGVMFRRTYESPASGWTASLSGTETVKQP